MVTIISKRERERIQRDMDRRVEEAKQQLADGENLVDRLTREIQEAEDDAWIEHFSNRDAGIIDINYIPTEDC